MSGAGREHGLATGVDHAMAPEDGLTVAVSPATLLVEHPRLFASLQAAFGVRFEPWCDGGPPCDGVIAAQRGAVAQRPAGAEGLPVLGLADGALAGPEHEVVLAAHTHVDRRLRDVVLHRHPAGAALDPAAGEEVLAAGPGGVAYWTRGGGTAPLQRVRAALPDLAVDEVLRDRLMPHNALALVAIVQFLRDLRPGGWRPPPIRASVIFDDPNLRRPSYGFIDYRELVAHADAHDYHASMAMIPLDVPGPNRAAVALFRERADRLSLVIHGNNHERRELMAPPDLDRALAMSAQALRRVERFERRTGLGVDRVMTPPHGLCSRTTAEALGALGYDALCAIHPCPWTEYPPPTRLLAGWHPADFLAGCAVIPRFPMDCSATEIALRAFLDQPIVLYGHHDDLAAGLEPLAIAAARVNRLGDVRWTSVAEIAHSNYTLRIDGPTAVVRPWSRRVRVTVPAGVQELRVELAPTVGGEPGVDGWSLTAPGSRVATGFGGARAVAGAGIAEVLLSTPWSVAASTVPAPAWRPWPGLRRAATEARDRLLPLRAAVQR